MEFTYIEFSIIHAPVYILDISWQLTRHVESIEIQEKNWMVGSALDI